MVTQTLLQQQTQRPWSKNARDCGGNVRLGYEVAFRQGLANTPDTGHRGEVTNGRAHPVPRSISKNRSAGTKTELADWKRQ